MKINKVKQKTQNLGNEVKVKFKTIVLDFPGGAVVKILPANAGHTGSIPGPVRSHMPQSN